MRLGPNLRYRSPSDRFTKELDFRRPLLGTFGRGKQL
jgi:hypothetical protein